MEKIIAFLEELRGTEVMKNVEVLAEHVTEDENEYFGGSDAVLLTDGEYYAGIGYNKVDGIFEVQGGPFLGGMLGLYSTKEFKTSDEVIEYLENLIRGGLFD